MRNPKDLNLKPAKTWDWFAVRFALAVMVLVIVYAYFN